MATQDVQSKEKRVKKSTEVVRDSDERVKRKKKEYENAKTNKNSSVSVPANDDELDIAERRAIEEYERGRGETSIR